MLPSQRSILPPADDEPRPRAWPRPQVPKIPMPPPFVKGIRLQDGLEVTEELHNTLADMLQHMNAAIDTLADLRTNKPAS